MNQPIKILDENLYDINYYLNKTSLFLQASYGLPEQYQMLCSVFKNLNDIFEQIINVNYILNSEDEYLPYIENKNVSKQLDNIGRIFGLNRNLSMKYPTDESKLPTKEEDLSVIKNVTLSDLAFIIYIKCQIIKQNFLGTREELGQLYNSEYDVSKNLIKLKFVYIPSETTNADVSIYWDNSDEFYTTNDLQLELRCLFLNGLLTIESLGINYTKVIQSIGNLARFYVEGAEENYVFYTDSPQAGQKVGVFA